MEKWNYHRLGPRRDAINVKESVSLDGKGNLVLTTKQVGDEYHTAMIGTKGKFDNCFGYYEGRVKFQTQLGHWSAFWLQSTTIGKVGDVQKNGTEIDIFEYLVRYKDTLHFNLHWDGYKDNHKTTGHKHEDKTLSENYHTVGLEWTPDEYVFYLDDKETWRTTVAVSHTKEFIILSLEVGEWAGDIKDAQLPDSLNVDYVRVYKK